MPVVALFQAPSLTQERYEESVRMITGGARLQSAADWPVASLLAHIAGEGENGFRVVDVWESEEACARFGEHLLPVLQAVGSTDGRRSTRRTRTCRRRRAGQASSRAGSNRSRSGSRSPRSARATRRPHANPSTLPWPE